MIVTVDPDFFAGYGPFLHRVIAKAVQPDEMILTGGTSFTFLGGSNRNALARHFSNGMLDTLLTMYGVLDAAAAPAAVPDSASG